jgi:hypothetical protein
MGVVRGQSPDVGMIRPDASILERYSTYLQNAELAALLPRVISEVLCLGLCRALPKES